MSSKNPPAEPDPHEVVEVWHPNVELPARVQRQSLAAMAPGWSTTKPPTLPTAAAPQE